MCRKGPDPSLPDCLLTGSLRPVLQSAVLGTLGPAPALDNQAQDAPDGVDKREVLSPALSSLSTSLGFQQRENLGSILLRFTKLQYRVLKMSHKSTAGLPCQGKQFCCKAAARAMFRDVEGPAAASPCSSPPREVVLGTGAPDAQGTQRARGRAARPRWTHLLPLRAQPGGH